jgi:hypothetical protein
MLYQKILAVILVGGVLSFIYADSQRYENDVGVDSIIYPGEYHTQYIGMTPVARVKNYGTATQSNFPVVCSIIGAGGALRYTNTRNITSLMTGETTVVAFPSWTPTICESLRVIMRTNLNTDSNPFNDRKTRITQIGTIGIMEGFNDVTFPPSGWRTIIGSGTYNWIRATAGSNPPCIPYEGPGMAEFQSWSASVGSWARLISPPIVVGSIMPQQCSLKFFMFHDPGYPGSGGDSVKVEISNDGANFNQVASFRRYEPTAEWIEHRIGLGSLSGIYYIGLLALSGYGSNMYIDYARTFDWTDIEETTKTISLITALNPSNPNPIINGLTHLSFSLAEPSQVSMKIYNTSGRLVKTLVNEFKGAGVYSVTWNCRDDYNRRAAEGIYFYTLEADGVKTQKKMLILR